MQSGIPKVNRHNLFGYVDEHFGLAAERTGPADETNLTALKLSGDGCAVFAGGKTLPILRPIAFIMQLAGVEHGLRVLAGDNNLPGCRGEFERWHRHLTIF